MMRYIIKVIHFSLSFILSLALLSAGAYAAYCLWDDQRMVSSAVHVREELSNFKPDSQEGDAGERASAFQELMAINPDVCAWVTLDNTHIDYPVLQGRTNIEYVNIDAYGNFALAGSIFLDVRNERDVSDAYSVLYGHHMKSGAMFGDLDLYKNEDFFRKNQTGTLFLPQRTMSLRVFACMVVCASEKRIFDPTQWSGDIQGLLDYVEEEALHIDRHAAQELQVCLDRGEGAQVLAFTTCSSEFVNARTVVLAAMYELSRQDWEDVIS